MKKFLAAAIIAILTSSMAANAAESRIQNFVDNGEVLCPETFEAFHREELEEFARIVRPFVGQVGLRGID